MVIKNWDFNYHYKSISCEKWKFLLVIGYVDNIANISLAQMVAIQNQNNSNLQKKIPIKCTKYIFDHDEEGDMIELEDSGIIS